MKMEIKMTSLKNNHKKRNVNSTEIKIIVTLCILIILMCINIYLQPSQEKILRPPILQSNPVTIVTGYFPFKKSKHSQKEYLSWIENFLTKVKMPMIIYTEPSMLSALSKFRGGYPTIFKVYDSVWKLPSVLNLRKMYQEQHKIDPEKEIHSPDLYAVWNSKAWMVSNAATNLSNPFKSKYFYWVDIGCFRKQSHPFKNWLDSEKVRKVVGDPDKKTLQFFAVQKFKNQNFKAISFEALSGRNYIIGAFFGGTVSGVKWWSEIFYKVHDMMLSRDRFVGKDQNVMNYAATHYNAENGAAKIIATCSCDQNPFNGCDSRWVYFQNWYAKLEEKVKGCGFNAKVYNITEFH